VTLPLTRVVLVPGTLALLPEYAGVEDPVADLRAACVEAVAWLGAEVTVVADPQGARVAAHLLESTVRTSDAPSYVVVGNGSATRTEKAPGHFDDRAEAFDAALGRCLEQGSLADIDRELARAVWADVEAIVELSGVVPDLELERVDYDGAPFGVQYWVMRWCAGTRGCQS
jgi:hypothetical protein